MMLLEIHGQWEVLLQPQTPQQIRLSGGPIRQDTGVSRQLTYELSDPLEIPAGDHSTYLVAAQAQVKYVHSIRSRLKKRSWLRRWISSTRKSPWGSYRNCSLRFISLKRLGLVMFVMVPEPTWTGSFRLKNWNGLSSGVLRLWINTGTSADACWRKSIPRRPLHINRSTKFLFS